MGEPLRRALGVAAALAVVLGVPAAASASAVRPPLETILQDDAVLLHGSDQEVRDALALIRDFGVERVRITAGWSSLTRGADGKERPDFDATDPAAYEQERWGAIDRAVALAAQSGLNVMVDVGFWAPLWATEDAEGPRARTRPDPHAFADFAVAVARRYSGAFVPPAPPAEGGPPPEPSQDESLLEQLLRPFGPSEEEPPPGDAPAAPAEPLPRVDIFTLWNEPNHPAFLQPLWHRRRGRPATPASPPVYRAMVQAAYPAMKAVRPDAKVLVGNTSSLGDNSSGGRYAIPPLRFIRELACVDRRLRPRAGGACRGFQAVPGDGWSHHPYSLDVPPGRPSPPNARDNARIGDLPRLTRLLARLAARGRIAPLLRNVYVTEYGYETRTYAGRPRFDPAVQATFLTWAEYLAWRNTRVRTFAQFLLRDLPLADPSARLARRPLGHWESGLLFADGRPKPAADAFRAGLHADRRGRRVWLWGRARGLQAPAAAVVETRRGGRWRRVVRGRVGGRTVLYRRVRFRRGARYRLVVRAPGRTMTSLPVRAR